MIIHPRKMAAKPHGCVSRKGLQRKSRRPAIGRVEELERKARFFAALPQKMRPNSYGLNNLYRYKILA
jgi:hypothetical protein